MVSWPHVHDASNAVVHDVLVHGREITLQSSLRSILHLDFI